MAIVTIEGSVTPSTFLGRGQRTTVERTAYINKLIRKGFVTVVKTPSQPQVVAEIVKKTESRLEIVDNERQLSGAPKRTAVKSEWMAFLDDQGIEYPESGATKSDLIALWDSVSGNPDGD